MTSDLRVLSTEKNCPVRRQHTAYTNKRSQCKGEVHSSPLNKLGGFVTSQQWMGDLKRFPSVSWFAHPWFSVQTHNYYPRFPGFDSRLYPTNYSGNGYRISNGSTQLREDNWVLYSRYEMAVGVDRRDGGGGLHATLWPENYCPFTWLQRNTNTLKDTCSKCLWNRNTALNSAVRMRDYFPSVPSTYYSRLLVAWQQ